MQPRNYENMTWQERRDVRNQYVGFQSGKCSYCNEPLSGQASNEVMKKRINLRLFPPNFLKYPIHLHHSHKTGMTIGAVHARCNAVLWQYHGE